MTGARNFARRPDDLRSRPSEVRETFRQARIALVEANLGLSDVELVAWLRKAGLFSPRTAGIDALYSVRRYREGLKNT